MLPTDIGLDTDAVLKRLHQIILIASTLLISWLGMQAMHESGHVLGAWLTGGRVARVVLNPLTFSRTDLAANPHPLVVVWAGPIIGALAPLILWTLLARLRLRGAFVARFVAGFCLIANGLYIGVGAFDRVGDCGDMLRHGSALWQLWLFGTAMTPLGIVLWHRQGIHFGLGNARGDVDRRVAVGALTLSITLLAACFLVGGE